MHRNNVDVILGLQYGDEGKGKIVYSLCMNNHYDYVMRFNGGSNAGHTIYHKGKKYITHMIPSGVFFGIKSIIGPGCVINEDKLIAEVEYLEGEGIKNVANSLYIAKNAHIITNEHLQEENNELRIGTTRQGIGPAYRDKYARIGRRAETSEKLKKLFRVVDIYELLYKYPQNHDILCEGAQSIHLDIDWGDYPYVTSSHTGLGAVIQNGISKSWIRNVYGVAKVYETYVGSKDFEGTASPEDRQCFEKIREFGKEYGATTGRPRKINWLDIGRLTRSILMNDVNVIIFNKIDVLQMLGKYGIVSTLLEGESVSYFSTEKEFLDYLKTFIREIDPTKNIKVWISDSMEDCSIS